MVGTLDSGLGGLDFRPGWVIVLCSWAKHFTLKMLLSPLGVEMGIGELSGKSDEMAGVALQWTAFLSRERQGGRGGGKVIVLLVSSFYGNQDKLELDGPLGRLYLTFTQGVQEVTEIGEFSGCQAELTTVVLGLENVVVIASYYYYISQLVCVL